MIRINIPGFCESDSGGPRWGDAQIIDDGVYYEVIDGYCGTGTSRLIRYLKDRNIKNPYLYISHAHYDHDYGIREIIADPYFSPRMLYCYDPESLKGGLGNSEIKDDYNYLKAVIAEAKAKKIPVIYLTHGDRIVHGEIEFYVYRDQQPYGSDDPHGWAYMNDNSLCFWFPALKYWTSGDGPMEIYTMCKKVGADPVFFKLPHHGNNCPRSQAQGMKRLGARYCWDNDYSTEITDFLKYGRGRAIEAGIKYLSCHGDINAIFFRKTAVIYKGSSIYRYECPYNGAPTITREVDLDIIKKVLAGKYGNGDARITNLLNGSYNPGVVQKEINYLLKLLKG